jgi:hypothetical protein
MMQKSGRPSAFYAILLIEFTEFATDQVVKF